MTLQLFSPFVFVFSGATKLWKRVLFIDFLSIAVKEKEKTNKFGNIYVYYQITQ